uniref:Uncharacterized protein n=1 Tax=Rhizophora mucronata TaxID=61149 RepID=A0A2P2QW70_RHIMU
MKVGKCMLLLICCQHVTRTVNNKISHHFPK